MNRSGSHRNEGNQKSGICFQRKINLGGLIFIGNPIDDYSNALGGLRQFLPSPPPLWHPPVAIVLYYLRKRAIIVSQTWVQVIQHHRIRPRPHWGQGWCKGGGSIIIEEVISIERKPLTFRTFEIQYDKNRSFGDCFLCHAGLHAGTRSSK